MTTDNQQKTPPHKEYIKTALQTESKVVSVNMILKKGNIWKILKLLKTTKLQKGTTPKIILTEKQLDNRRQQRSVHDWEYNRLILCILVSLTKLKHLQPIY